MGVTASIGTHQASGRYVYEMNAEGEANWSGDTYPATLRLQLDLAGPDRPLEQVPWPRGVYELGRSGTNKFELRLDGAQAGDFDVSEGFALVAEASNDRIAGSVFITETWRLHAPVPVPEVHDPPLVFRFLIER
jgi:hypothetical protein